ncbi:MAG: iron-sulfur cluster assembly scaffold protein [Wenzhouxiangella sp.]
MAIEQLYRDIVLEHNRWPRNFKRLEQATHSARGQDASCGDDLLIELKLVDDTVHEAAFSGDACAVTQAAASLLTLWLRERSPAEVRSGLARFTALLLDPQAPRDPVLGDLNELQPVGAFPARRRNALLPFRTAVKALDSPV